MRKDHPAELRTLSDVIREVNGRWGSAKVELSLDGNGKWTAFFQCIEVADQHRDKQRFIMASTAPAALEAFMSWLRGKTIRHIALTSSGVSGLWVTVPGDLPTPPLSDPS